MDVIVPLNAYVQPDPKSYGWQVDNIRQRFGSAGHTTLGHRVREKMMGLSEKFGDEFPLVAYEAAQLVTVKEYWRLVYKAIDDAYPDAAILTDRLPAHVTQVSSFGLLIRDLRLQAMVESFPRLRLTRLDTRPKVAVGERRSLCDLIDDAVGLGNRVAASLGYRLGKVKLRKLPPAVTSQAVMLTQRSKSSRLAMQLTGVVDFTMLSHDDLVRSEALTTFQAGLACDALILQYLQHRIQHLAAMREAIAQLTDRGWRILLTDQEHDPYVRLLIEAALARDNMSVIATPEGAQSLMGSEIFSAARDVWVNDRRIIRCATSKGEAMRMAEVFGVPTILSGYLAKPPTAVGKTNWFVKRVVGRLVRGMSTQRRPLVLVNVDNEPDLGVSRAGVPSMAEKLASLKHMATALHKAGVPFIVTCKSPEGRNAIKATCRPCSSGVFAHVPWRLLMAVSTVVVQRDSSLGPEAAAAGYPTIVWDDLGLPLGSREWLESNEPWVQYCTDESDLLSALDRVWHGITPKEHPQLWDLIKPEHQVADWIVRHCSRRRGVQSD